MIMVLKNNLIEIRNLGSFKKIKKKYLPIIKEVELFCLKEFKKNLKSFYVRGSVCSGQDTKFSDLDFVIVTQKDINKKQENKLIKYSNTLQAKYHFVNGFELAPVSIKKLLKSKTYFNLRINLKNNSVLVCGDDIGTLLPSVFTNKMLSMQMFDYAHKEYIISKKYFSSNVDRDYLAETRGSSFWCSWIMRIIVRSGIGVLAFSENKYSNDARKISKKMGKKYPEFKTLFEQSSKWIVKPISNKKKILDFLNKNAEPYFIYWKKLLK